MRIPSANIERIKSIYAAFGRGDIAYILESVHPEVDWEPGAHHGDRIPWLQPGRGRDAVSAFFRALGALRFEAFEVIAVMGEGPWVVGLCRVEAVHTGTGGRLVEPCEAHIWRLDEQGRIVSMRHAADTLHHAEVCGSL